MEHKIFGNIAQYARLDFQKGEQAWSSRGAIMAYSSGMNWKLRVPGGITGAARRSLSGEGIALASLEAAEDKQYVLLAANSPGYIFEWDLQDGPVLTTRGAFLAAWGEQININVTIARRAGAALFGGAGLFLQQVSGIGTVLIHASGDYSDFRLGDGEQILISTDNLAAFSKSVDYNIKRVGGVRKILFGKEGLFMTSMTGPGRVILQSMDKSAWED